MTEERTQFEQENDLGRGGGKVDDETLDEAWREAARRRSTANEEDPQAPEQPLERQGTTRRGV